MAKLIDGKAVSASVRAQVAEEVEQLKQQGVTPGLAVVIVGDDPASRTYVNNKKRPAHRRASIRKSMPCLPRPRRKN